MRIKDEDLFVAFSRYKRALDQTGIAVPGYQLQYIEGSKTMGISYKLAWVNQESGAISKALGADMNGYIGSTAKEAWENLHTIARTIEDIVYYQKYHA